MAEPVHSVSGLTALIRDQLEGRFSGLWVEGEISNHRIPGSGHHYFTLKDPFAQLACVFFKGAASRCPVRLADGMRVQVYGNLSVYEARGQYQMVAQVVQPRGLGDLQAQFEALKRKLEAEGLFAPERKQPLPPFPERIGIVTSSSGAALRDILNVLSRRSPWLQVQIYPARVQGDGAAEEVAAGIRFFDRLTGETRPDLILVARGGGSIEDLWAFNDEQLARTIAACSLPVISGVGHEIDFTIVDFVADRREPTPSAAAENAAPEGASLRRHLGRLRETYDARIQQRLAYLQRHALSLKREVEAREPGRKLRSWAQTVDYLEERMERGLAARMQQGRTDWESAGRALQRLHPERRLDRLRERLDQLGLSMERAAEQRCDEAERRVHTLAELLQTLSPQSVLKRGYSITTDATGRALTDAQQVRPGDVLRTRLAQGEITSRAE